MAGHPRARPRLTAAFATALAVLLAARSASACPVCGQGADGSEGAYLFMSGVLSALPLLIVAGIAGWIVAHTRSVARSRGDEEVKETEASGGAKATERGCPSPHSP